MKIKQKQRAKPMRNFALSMVNPLTLSLSPWGLCQNRRNERKPTKGDGRADEKALERNLQAFGFKGFNCLKRLRFQHQGHLPIHLLTLRVLKLWNPFVRSLLTSNRLRYSHVGRGEGGELHFDLIPSCGESLFVQFMNFCRKMFEDCL